MDSADTGGGFSPLDISSHFKAFIEAMADGVAVFDMEGRVLFLNQALARINGYANPEAMRQDLAYFASIYVLQTRDGRRVPVENWPVSKVLRGEVVEDCPLRAIRTDTGLELDLCFSGIPVRDAKGRQILAVLIARDVTAERRSEALQREREERYRRILETMLDGFCIIRMIFDEAGRPVDYLFLEVNSAFERQTGLADAAGRKVSELVPDLDPFWFEEYGKVALTGQPVRFESHAPAMGRWFEVSANRIGNPEDREVALVFREVSDRKRTEAAVQASERFLRRVLDNLFAFVGVTDLHGTLVGANRAPLDAAGLALEDVLGRKCWDTHWFAWSEEVKEKVRDAFERAARGETCRFDVVIRLKGEERATIDFQLAPLRDETGALTHLIPSAVDITERSRIEREKRKFSLLVEASDDLVGLATEDGRFTFLNRAGRALVGLDGAPLPEGPLGGLIHPEDAGILPVALRAALADGHWQGELRLRHLRTDQAIPAWFNLFPVHDPEIGRPLALAVVARDLTQLREKEEQLRHSQKVEAIGKLAGGVAHDFNNLLTAINGYSDMLLEAMPQGDPKREFLLEIHKSGQRAAALTSQLLAYSRKQMFQPKVLDLNETVDESARLLRRLIGEDIDLVLDPGPALLAVKADPNQIHQILLNLCLNARDAMPSGGRLVIRTRNEEARPADVPAPRGHRHVFMEVVDTGMGIPREIQARIFEPFYTTKEVGKGTGLGLSSVFGIVEQSGGTITVESEPGRGATFRIRLPALESEAVQAEGEVLEEAGREALRKGSILLVEDEETVRRFVRSLLEQEGFSVLEARDGVEALDLLAAPESRPDLVLSDVVMPRMGGPQLASRLRKERPGLRILLMSGYSPESLPTREQDGETVDFIQKPFTPQALMARIQEILQLSST